MRVAGSNNFVLGFARSNIRTISSAVWMQYANMHQLRVALIPVYVYATNVSNAKNIDRHINGNFVSLKKNCHPVVVLVCCWYRVTSDVDTRNSTIADKPRDATGGWPTKTHPSPYVLLCRIWSFCVKGYRHKYRRTPTIGERWKSALLRWKAWLAPKIPKIPSATCVTTSNLVVLRQRVYV